VLIRRTHEGCLKQAAICIGSRCPLTLSYKQSLELHRKLGSEPPRNSSARCSDRSAASFSSCSCHSVAEPVWVTLSAATGPACQLLQNCHATKGFVQVHRQLEPEAPATQQCKTAGQHVRHEAQLASLMNVLWAVCSTRSNASVAAG
jgi:hypothetical protein